MRQMLSWISLIRRRAQQTYWEFVARRTKRSPFPGSNEYWQNRYAHGGDSGVGSYGKFAAFKAEVINAFVSTHLVRSVIEFGCGDGNQLTLAKYPAYLGLDISEAAIAKCRALFAADPTKCFEPIDLYRGQTADLALSLDVIYHLVEDEVFEAYMTRLFHAADRYVIIYSSDTEDNRGLENTHVRHRAISRWIGHQVSQWRLIEHIPNRYPYKGDYREGSFADFFVYERVASRQPV